MTLLLRGAIAAALLACAPATPGIELSVSEPGFLSIDGVYYGFGLRQPEPPIATQAKIAMLGAEGFHLQTLFDPGECTRNDGSPATRSGAGTPRLRHADLPLAESGLIEGLALAVAAPGLPPSLGIAQCRGISVVHWRSSDGDVRCAERIRFPFERGECPQLDRSDPGYISHSDFE